MDRRTTLYRLSALSMLPLISRNMLEDKMTTRPIPSSGEALPIVGLGTWQTFDISPNSGDAAPLKEVLRTLIKHGGSVVDSSPMYGQSEDATGALSTEVGVNNKLFIATKVWTTGKENGIRQMKTSMSLLRRSKIDLMQVHNLTDWQTHLTTLREWKDQGKLRYIGITHYTESAYTQIERILKTEPIDFLQINYSMRSRKAEERLFPLAEEKKVAILINRPFEEGALLQAVKGKQLPSWAAEIDCASWGQFFLKYMLSHPAVNCVIPGTTKAHHMADNAMAGFGRLPDANFRQRMLSVVG